MTTVRFPISFNRPMAVLMTVLGCPPRTSYVDVDERSITVRMGWSFHAVVPVENIGTVRDIAERRISMGVHGWRGRWLVNGSGRRLVRIDVAPPTRGRMLGLPVKIRELTVSAEDPTALVDAIRRRTRPTPN